MQIVTAGKGRDELNLKSTLTLFGLLSKYLSLSVTRYIITPLATKNIANQISLKAQQSHTQ